jgi:tRNA nucleotidyltransferase/poly(A) polymerase
MLLKRCAPERIREELMRIFASPRTHATLVLMDKSGLLDVVFPDARVLRRTAPRYYGKGGVLKHTLDSVRYFEEIENGLGSWFPGSQGKIRAYLLEEVAGFPRFAHCKWALVLHDIGKPATAKIIHGRLRFFEHEHVGADRVFKLADAYRWSRDETERYARLVRHHMRPGNLAAHQPVTDKAIHRFFRDLGNDGVAMLLVSLADHLTYLTRAQRRARASAHEKITIHMIRRFYHHAARVTPPKIVNGTDVMHAFHLPPSVLIGRLLEDVTEAQSEGKIKTRDQALAYLKGRLEWHQQQIASKTPVS